MSKTKLAVIALILANTIWGAAPPIFKWSLQDIGPFTLAFLRFGIAALIFLPFCYNKLKIRTKDWTRLFLIGFFGISINISFFFLGLQHAPSINASIIGSAGPIVIIFASLWFLHQKPKRNMLIGAFVGLFGVLLIISKPLFTHGPNISIYGNILYVISMIAAAIPVLLGQKVLKRYSISTVAFWTFFIGTITFLPFCIQEIQTGSAVTQWNMQTIIGVTFGALLSSATAYYLFYWAIKWLKSDDVGVFLYLDPVVTILIAIPLLHEYPDVIYGIGGFLVFFGIFISEGRIHWHPIHKLWK